MRDVTLAFAVLSTEALPLPPVSRHSCSGSKRPRATPGRPGYRSPSAGRGPTKQIAFIQHGPARRIAVDDQPSELTRKIAGLRPSRISAKVAASAWLRSITLPVRTARRTCGTIKRHAPAHLVIDHAARFVPHNAKIRAARRRFFQHGICGVDPALWLGPFTKKTSRPKFVIGNQIGNTHDLLDFTVMQIGSRIEFPERLGIKPDKIRIDPGLIMDVARFAD